MHMRKVFARNSPLEYMTVSGGSEKRGASKRCSQANVVCQRQFPSHVPTASECGFTFRHMKAVNDAGTVRKQFNDGRGNQIWRERQSPSQRGEL